MDTPDSHETIDRREALRRAALLLGGVISAPTIAGLLADDRAWAAPAQGWVPRTLTSAQAELVATIAEHVIPTTDTPGGRAAGVHRFADALLTSHYKGADVDRFLIGLAGVDFRARRAHGRTFVRCTPRQQAAILTQMDRDAYPARGAVAMAERAQQPPPRDPIIGPSSGGSGSLAQRAPTDTEVQEEVGSEWFWRRMKEVILVGYYTSRQGATQELRVNPMGVWRGDIPYAPIGRSWA